MATSTLVAIEQYLGTSYRPDVEYIDGALKQKPLAHWSHGRIQVLLGNWFGAHEEDWGIFVAAKVRTRVSGVRVCHGESWTETTRFTVDGSAICLDVTDLFARLEKSL